MIYGCVRVPFDEIFDVSNGVLTARHPIRVTGITCMKGLKLRPGMIVGGIDFTNWYGHDLEVHDEYPNTNEWVRVIRGIYGEDPTPTTTNDTDK